MQRTAAGAAQRARARASPRSTRCPELARAVAKLERDLAGRGRVLVRYSGTEPLARVMIEGDDEARIGALADELCDVLRKAIGEAAK